MIEILGEVVYPKAPNFTLNRDYPMISDINSIINSIDCFHIT